MDDFRAWCEALASRGEAVLRARGGSMWPSVRDGALLRVRAARPAAGDIAVLKVGDALVCHRVLAIGPRHVTVKGDALTRAETYRVPRDAQVLGRVVGGRRRSGALIGLPVAIVRRLLA